jgi:AraC-like DNA-binding protein
MDINFFNPRSVVLFVCLLQGVVFAAMMFWRSRKRKTQADFWLAVLLLVMCSGLITPLIGFAGLYDAFQDLTFFPFEIVFAHAPCVYLYVVSLTDSRRRFQTKDLLHFIPALVYVACRLILFSQNLEFKSWYDDQIQSPVITPIQNVLLIFWNLIYFYFAIKHYRKYRGWLNDNFSNTELIKFKWLRNFLYLFTFLIILSASFEAVNSFVTPLNYFQFYYFDAILALLTYYLAIAGYLRSQPIELNFAPARENVFADKFQPQEQSVEKFIEKSAEKTAIEFTPKKPILAANEADKLKVRLQLLMEREKPFLNPQLTLSDLSRQIGVGSNVLSFVINDRFGKNFNDFINEYRIEEVKNRLSGGAAENLSLLGVAFECGFNSKATFNRAFKKAVGASPKEFQEQIGLDLQKQVSNHAN